MDIKDSGQRRTTASGAQRDRHTGKGRCDLLAARALLRRSVIFEQGAEKYEARNWEKGMPVSWFADSAMRHLLKFLAGDIDEPHLDQAGWNLDCAAEVEERVKQGLLPVALLDLPIYDNVEWVKQQRATEYLRPAILDQAAKQVCEQGSHEKFRAAWQAISEPVKWQAPHALPGTPAKPPEKPQTRTPRSLRIYVAGPFSAPTQEARDHHCRRACEIGLALMKRGHLVHIPHAATAPLDGHFHYEDYMELDFSIIQHWAQAIFLVGHSPGADREAALGNVYHLPIYERVEDTPWAVVNVQ